MKPIQAILFFISVPLFLNAQQIDTENSKVTFAVRNMKIRTVKGTFTGMKGKINFDENNLSNSKFSICIDTKTINTKSKKRDKHLKNKDFFEVEKYPTICFVSETIEKNKGNYLVKGKLTMHGITKTITIPLNYKDNVFLGEFELDRRDYEIGAKGGFMVGKTIKISIHCKLKQA